MRCWLLSHLAPAPAPTLPLSSGTALAHDSHSLSEYGNPLRLTAILRAYFVAVFSFLSFCFVFGLILSATKSMMIKLKRSGERKWKAKKLKWVQQRLLQHLIQLQLFSDPWWRQALPLLLFSVSLFLALSLCFSLSLPALWSSKMKPKLTHL